MRNRKLTRDELLDKTRQQADTIHVLSEVATLARAGLEAAAVKVDLGDGGTWFMIGRERAGGGLGWFQSGGYMTLDEAFQASKRDATIMGGWRHEWHDAIRTYVRGGMTV